MIYAQTSDWDWATKAGGPSVDKGNAISVDASGNSYVAGYFSGSISLGATTLTSSGYQDIYVAKISPTGNWLWARKVGGTGTELALDITVDTAGNAYVIGSFSSPTVAFGSTTLTRTAYSSSADVFVAKINASGTWVWAKKLGGTGVDDGLSVAVDSNSNVYVTGAFRNTVTVETTPSTTLTSLGYSDIFVAKLSSTGTWLWARRAGGANPDNGNSLTVDPEGNVYVCGAFNSNSADFGQFTLTNTGTSTNDIFVSKLDTNGNWQWARKAGSTGTEAAYSITRDTANNFYVAGSFSGNAYFGDNILYSSGAYDIYVAKISGTGDWLWASKAGGTGYDGANGVAVDDNSNVFVVGNFTQTGQFGSFSLTCQGDKDGFLGKLNPNGVWQWAERIGGSAEDSVNGVDLNGDQDILICGDFENSIQFGSTTLTSSGAEDNFFAKMFNSTTVSPTVHILSPNGGETWYVGSVHPITWTSEIVNSVFLDYSLNNGSTWNPINTAPVSAGTGSYDWTIPNVSSTQARVRVRDAGDTNTNDISDAAFTITTAPNPPSANFSGSPTSGYEPLTVQFTDQSTAGSGTITAWAWSFGDGGSSTQQNPQHIYQNNGTYTVSLTVTNSFGLTGNYVRHNYITVQPTVPELTLLSESSLDFGAVDVGSQSAYQDVVLSNTGTANLIISDIHFSGAPLHFEYQVSNPNITIAPGASTTIPVRFIPQAVGELNDILHIVNNSSNMQVLQIPLSGIGTAVIYPPQAAFTANPTSGLAPLTVQFTDQSTCLSGQIMSWTWNFGDGSTSNLQNPTHVYESAGVYTVSLTIYTSMQATSTATQEDCITVSPPSGNLSLLSASTLTFPATYVTAVSSYQQVRLRNNGNRTVNITNLYFSGSGLHFQFLATDENRLIQPGETDTLFVRFAPIARGTLTDTFCIVNDSDNLPLINIALTGTSNYAPPTPPTNVEAYITGADLRLTWELVEQDILGNDIEIDYYAVFVSENNEDTGFVFHGLTYEENYIHASATNYAGQMLYRVYAIAVTPDRELDDATRLEMDRFFDQNLTQGMSLGEFRAVLRQAEDMFDK
ncbi:MAG: PKD domain-containing protein [Candidatus Syntrophosphaera sp.]|nr:PKD domain-containing protein [Candidatus Syntrophosphaera sp.]